MESNKKYEIKMFTFDLPLDRNADLLVLDKSSTLNKLDKTSIFEIYNSESENLESIIRYDWSQNSFEEANYLYVPETDFLFFGAGGSWGIVDLNNLKLIRLEEVTLFWHFERHNNTIVTIEELSAESIDLNGKTIDQVNIDPPFETMVFEDRIEFKCIVYGKQVLKLVKN